MATQEAEAKDGILETVRTVVYALLIAGLFRTLFFQPFWIPSGSMKDTLLIGDFLFVNKMAYGYSQHSCPFSMCTFIDGRWLGREPDRGDVIVFRQNDTDYVKRVVGLPGETIQVRGGVLHIDGAPVELEPAGRFAEPYEPQGRPARNPRTGRLVERLPRCGEIVDGVCLKDRFIETLPGGVSHSILDIGPQAADDTQRYLVPEGHYFFMGDNRDASSDSRFLPGSTDVLSIQASEGTRVGYVPYENLIGRADRVMFSSAGRRVLYFWTWRGDRFFERID